MRAGSNPELCSRVMDPPNEDISQPFRSVKRGIVNEHCITKRTDCLPLRFFCAKVDVKVLDSRGAYSEHADPIKQWKDYQSTGPENLRSHYSLNRRVGGDLSRGKRIQEWRRVAKKTSVLPGWRTIPVAGQSNDGGKRTLKPQRVGGR